MKIEDYEKEAQYLGYPNLTEFLNEESIKKIDMYYLAWECDPESWIMCNGDIITTSHGHYYVMTKEEWQEYKKEMLDYVEIIKDIGTISKEN